MLLDDHDPVVMTAPAMPAAITMPAVLGPRAITMVMAVITATLDHNGLGTCN